MLCLCVSWISYVYSQSEGYVPGYLIVKMRPSTGLSAMQAESIHTKMGALSVKPLQFKNGLQATAVDGAVYVVEFPKDQNIEVVAQQYQSSGEVVYAEPNYIVESHASSDALYSRQSYFSYSDLSLLLDMPVNNSVIVAVIDSGVDGEHPDIVHAMWKNTAEKGDGKDDDRNGYIDDVSGYNFYGYFQGLDNANTKDGFGHGTHIAGIIAAESGNQTGISGLSQAAKILNVKFLNSAGIGNQVDAAVAIRYAVDMGAKVINCSWGYYQYDTVLKDAVAYAISKGVIVVASAGNSGQDYPQYPASFDSVLAVTSVEQNLTRSDFSSWGSSVSFAEYGRSVYSLAPNNNYAYKSGTSQSAAVLTGIISSILGYDSTYTAREVKSILIQSTKDLGPSGKDVDTGYGIVSISKLMGNLESYNHSRHTGTPIVLSESASLTLENILNFPNPFGSSGTKFGFDLSSSAEVTVSVYNAWGSLVRTIESSLASGYQTVSWDGKDDSGLTLPNGTYFYVVKAVKEGQVQKGKGKLTILR